MQDNWGPIFRMNTGFAPHRRKTDFAKCKISGRFRVVSFQVSTICIVLVENTVVLRVPIQKQRRTEKMKKNHLFQDTLEREIQDLLAPYPDPMGRTDFRKACRIGTRTSIYLLQSGLVPCENTGKQTRCYKIAKAAWSSRNTTPRPAAGTRTTRVTKRRPSA